MKKTTDIINILTDKTPAAALLNDNCYISRLFDKTIELHFCGLYGLLPEKIYNIKDAPPDQLIKEIKTAAADYIHNASPGYYIENITKNLPPL